MVEQKEWAEFRKSGLLLLVNQFLHIFGWAIVFEMDGEKVKTAYPARVKFRGFDNDDTTKAYKSISKYMVENAEELEKETNE